MAAPRYMLPNDDADQRIVQSVTVPANSRTTIDVETVAPLLANTPVSTLIRSDVGIIVERSMYWLDISIGWREAHNSVAVTTAALRWGRVGWPHRRPARLPDVHSAGESESLVCLI
jgi:hypothetical protein